jgi:hypothetical protein
VARESDQFVQEVRQEAERKTADRSSSHPPAPVRILGTSRSRLTAGFPLPPQEGPRRTVPCSPGRVPPSFVGGARFPARLPPVPEPVHEDVPRVKPMTRPIRTPVRCRYRAGQQARHHRHCRHALDRCHAYSHPAAFGYRSRPRPTAQRRNELSQGGRAAASSRDYSGCPRTQTYSLCQD